MPRSFKPLDITGLKTYPLAARKSTVSSNNFGKNWIKGGSFSNFLNSFPNILGARDIKAVISAITTAFKSEKTIVMAMGAHVIKVGLNPVVIDLMEKGIISAIALNGAGIIHDIEIAMTGQTSEDVAATIGNGSFGMARETCSFLSEAIEDAGENNLGLGEAVGKAVIEQKLPLSNLSILGTGFRLGIPVTVHIAIGTDIIHIHPQFNAENAGGASHRDFIKFASVIASLKQGVYLNVGSAVILPEVFLKALTLTRNLGHDVDNFTAVNMDFIRHYRPITNVVNRPTSKGGQGINLIGHHEIMFPLIAAGVIEQL